MKGHSVGTVYRRTDTIPYIEFWQQPFLHWLLAHLYGFWERMSWRAMKPVEKLHRRWFEDDNEFYIPLTNRQDIRCDDLIRRSRITLAIIYITQDQHDIVTGKKLPQETPRHQALKPIQP